jgi:hypothetical protein
MNTLIHEQLKTYRSNNPIETKREFSDEERQALADKGNAMPDGSYPISTVQDLKNAIQSYGRAKNKDKVKQHIIRRARALGRIDLLPEGWISEKSARAKLTEYRIKAKDPDAPANTQVPSEGGHLVHPDKPKKRKRVKRVCKLLKCKNAQGGVCVYGSGQGDVYDRPGDCPELQGNPTASESNRH